MALYHLHIGVIGRSGGQTAVAAAAYRACERIVNETDGVIHDYRKNSQFARDMDIAFQKELSLEDNIDCLKKWIDNNFTKRGIVADICVHAGHKNGKEGQNVSNNNTKV